MSSPHEPLSGDLAARLAWAARHLRTADNPSWPDISGAVIATVRSAARSGWPVRAALGDLGADADRASTSPVGPVREQTYVSERVIRYYVSKAMALHQGCALSNVRLDLDGTDLQGVTVDVVGAHGVDLARLGGRVRASVASLLGELLGPIGAPVDPERIHLRVVDLVVGDPHTT
jgi:hypothetical protein